MFYETIICTFIANYIKLNGGKNQNMKSYEININFIIFSL